MDIHENAEQNVVTATFELPGLKKEDVNIDIRNNRLVISGETTHSKDFEDNGYVHRERSIGKLSRTLPLPSGTKVNFMRTFFGKFKEANACVYSQTLLKQPWRTGY